MKEEVARGPHRPQEYFQEPFKDTHIFAQEMGKRILNEVMSFQRVSVSEKSCRAIDCENCFSPHLEKVISAVKENRPVVFVLPAFPGKSPNLEKVLGPLPDQAERLSLEFLSGICRKIRRYYSPGAEIILCSDGRVFSDVVGIKEDDVSAYQRELGRLMSELSLNDLSLFNLDDVYRGVHFVQMREELMKNYGRTLGHLQEKVRRGKEATATLEEREAHRMYLGITRFLFEDSLHAQQTKSRRAIQVESRARAYEVIRRSNAWSELIAEIFPAAVRLSIHPQVCGSKKLGIRLIGRENWMTPWHGVAVETDQGYVLLKRTQALSLGGELMYASDGRPSHYRLMMNEGKADA